MNLDDESLLSAYLDDELEPADRLPVEWSVESSPPLADQLRALAMARDAVAGLPRSSAPRDVAFAVVADLAAARARARRPSRLRASGQLAAAAAGLAAMAACLLLAVVLLHRSTHDDAHPGLFTFLDRIDHPDRPHTLPQAGLGAPPRVASNVIATKPTPPAPGATGAAPPAPRTAPADPPAPVEEARDSARRRQVAGMIDQDRVVRVVIVTDIIDASERVRSLIHQDARKDPDFGRITVGQGIVVDPGRPEGADVYPVVLDEPGSRHLVARLEKEFPGLMVEPDVSPELLTQLPEVGQVAIFRGTGAGRLVEPPDEVKPYIARKDHPPRDEYARPEILPIDDASTPLVARGAGSGSRHDGDLPEPPLPTTEDLVLGPRPSRRSSGSVAVLVWVTRPTRR